MGCLGGFGFSIIVSTLMLAANFFSKRNLTFKICAAILWPITFETERRITYMKKRFLCVALCAVFLLCGGTGCQLIPNPHVRTGTYNGQTITMEYTLKTNLEYPVGMGYIPMINDYAVFWDMSDYGPKVQGDTWNALDRQGEVLFDEPYMELTYFNSNGQAAAQKQSGGYVLVTAE